MRYIQRIFNANRSGPLAAYPSPVELLRKIQKLTSARKFIENDDFQMNKNFIENWVIYFIFQKS